MKLAGYALIVVAFLAAAYVAVAQPLLVDWQSFGALLAAGVVGVVLVRLAVRREAHHEEVLSANISAIEASLGHLATAAERLDEAKGGVDVYDLRHRIDADFADDLGAFVAARESIAVSFGLEAYAAVMNPFAAGERYLARVWSASTDGYIDEAHEYLTRAREQFAEALATFRGLGKPAG
jgi:membrane protein implicated in regulation of membrane protease activity